LIAEVDRYTEHALEKITNDILQARERIHMFLTKLSVGDVSNDPKYAILYTSTRGFFGFFFEILNRFLDDFTEDVYFMHEELLQELEAQYEVNKSMYEQIENWNELFLEFQEFEVKPTKNRFDLEFCFVFYRKTRVILNDFTVEVTALSPKKKLERNSKPLFVNMKFV